MISAGLFVVIGAALSAAVAGALSDPSARGS